MEITYIYGKVILLRFPTAVTPLQSQSTEMVGIFHKWKSCHKRKSCLIRLTINTNLFISSYHYFTLFSRINLFFSLVQTTNLNLKRLKTLQQPCTNRLAPTIWTLVNAKTYLDEVLGPKIPSTTWTWNPMFKRNENKKFRLAQNLTMGETDFIQFIRLKNQLVVAVRDFSKEESLPLCKWNY